MDQCVGCYESVRLASHFIGLNFQEFAQIYGNDNRNDKSYDIKYCYLRIQDYFECFDCLPISLRNHVFKKTYQECN